MIKLCRPIVYYKKNIFCCYCLAQLLLPPPNESAAAVPFPAVRHLKNVNSKRISLFWQEKSDSKAHQSIIRRTKGSGFNSQYRERQRRFSFYLFSFLFCKKSHLAGFGEFGNCKLLMSSPNQLTSKVSGKMVALKALYLWRMFNT